MALTNNYPGIGYTTAGKNFNFYQKILVTSTTFGGGSVDGFQPDIIIPFSTQTVMLLNESISGVIEYSFNGQILAGELDSSLPSRAMTFDNRKVSKIWFRIKAGSASNLTVRIDAWSL